MATGKTLTIDPRKHALWKLLQRRGDIVQLQHITGYSHPVITTAFKRGYVFKKELEKQIDDYLEPRAKELNIVTDEEHAKVDFNALVELHEKMQPIIERLKNSLWKTNQ